MTIGDDGANGVDPNPGNNTFTLVTPVQQGPTYVSGPISTNTTWYHGFSPYIVTGDVTVNSEVTLTIQPGVIIKADPHVD